MPPLTPDLLRQVPLFASLESSVLEALSQQCRRRQFRPGETLFHEGDPGHTLYLVVAGNVRIQKVTVLGKVIHIATLGPGQPFGELSLIDNEPRMADAITADACDLVMLDRERFRRCVVEQPNLAWNVMACLAERLRGAANRLEAQQELDVCGRVAAALLEMGGPKHTPVKVTQQVLADQVGATRESVNRALAQLKALGALRVEGRALVVVDARRLQQYSSSTLMAGGTP